MKWSAAKLPGDTSKRRRFSFAGLDSVVALAGTLLLLTFAGPLFNSFMRFPGQLELVRAINSHPVKIETDPNSPPLCYVGGERLRLALRLHVSPQLEGQQVFIEGAAGDGRLFFGTAKVIGADVSFPKLSASHCFQRRAEHDEALSIHWRASRDGGATFRPVGQTQHRLFVTLHEPEPSALRETILEISSHGAAGCTSDAAVVAGIWREFSRRNPDGTLPGLRRADGQPLRYWCDDFTRFATEIIRDCHTLDALLNRHRQSPLAGVGTCQAWSELFAQTLLAQGIQGVQTLCVVPPKGATGFLMDTTEYRTLHGRLSPRPVIHGQGTPNPPFAFYNHALVEFRGALYDPSYGNGPFTGATLEDAVLAWEKATVGALVTDEIRDGRTNRTAQPLCARAGL